MHYGAIGSLRGPLHGGANEAAMALIDQYETPEQVERGVREMLERKEVIMGFGHAIYRTSDPRNTVIKGWAEKLADIVGDQRYYPVSCAVEKVMWDEKELFANADFFTRRRTTSWASRQNYLRQFSSVRDSRGGLLTSWNNVQIIESFDPVLITLAPSQGRLSR